MLLTMVLVTILMVVVWYAIEDDPMLRWVFLVGLAAAALGLFN